MSHSVSYGPVTVVVDKDDPVFNVSTGKYFKRHIKLVSTRCRRLYFKLELDFGSDFKLLLHEMQPVKLK